MDERRDGPRWLCDDDDNDDDELTVALLVSSPGDRRPVSSL